MIATVEFLKYIFLILTFIALLDTNSAVSRSYVKLFNTKLIKI